MLLNADAKALEWVCATYLSQDDTAKKEIWDEVDQHTDNQEKFGLPSRLVAKTFVFRLIYGGSAYSYAMDHNFKDIGGEKYWQGVIKKFYNKYQGLAKWHEKIMFDATKHLHLTMPTGRRYDFKPELNSMGKPKMPRTRILNYPVQGLGADLMSIVRVSIANRLRGRKNVDLINTVHDSVMIDYDDNLNDTDELVSIVEQAFHDIPANFYKLFGTKFNLPTRVDVQVGNNWGEMK